MTKIKICGLSRTRDIDFINEGKPDYCGFVIDAPKSRRNITPKQAASLRSRLSEFVIPVGVFVNAPLGEVAALLNDKTISMAQLHGNEDEKYIRALRALTGAPIIKAFPANSQNSLKKAVSCSADHILLDNGSGGTGKSFDWSLLENLTRPYILAGGLTPGNLMDAVTRFHPFCVDLSSGVETDGKKDREKILAAIAAVRR